MILRPAFLILYLMIFTGFTESYALPDNAKTVNYSSVATSFGISLITIHTDTLLLRKPIVKDWMQTRIAVAKLQKQMKNNSSYDDVVQEFYAKRADLLQSQGWTVDEFDTVKERIHAAISAMDISEELEESRADHEKEITEIKNNDFYTEDQKQELINSLKKMREQKRIQFIEPTKPDWPAIQPYRSTFRKMTSWIAGNTSTIPVIE